MAGSRRVSKLCSVAGVAFLTLTGSAFAGGSLKDEPKAEREFTYSFTLTGTSDYVFRGVSQSDNDPTIQGSFGIGYGIFYAGIWATGIDWTSDPDANIEADYYAGIKPTWGKATFDFGVIYYDYPGAWNGYDLLELKAGVSGEIVDKLSGSATFYYSPDYKDKEWGVYEFGLAYALPKLHVFDPSISGLYGYVDDYNGGTSYGYWNAGLSLAVEKLTFDLRYWDTDLNAGECLGYTGNNTNLCDERFVFSATLALP